MSLREIHKLLLLAADQTEVLEKSLDEVELEEKLFNMRADIDQIIFTHVLPLAKKLGDYPPITKVEIEILKTVNNCK